MQETQERRVRSLAQGDPLEGNSSPPVFLPGEPHGERGLVGYSPQGRRVRRRPSNETTTNPSVVATQSGPTLWDPFFAIPWTVAWQASVHRMLQARLEWADIPLSRETFQPGIEPGFPVLQANSLPSKPPRKPFEQVLYHAYFTDRKDPRRWLWDKSLNVGVLPSGVLD